jgi:hypothetical protein
MLVANEVVCSRVAHHGAPMHRIDTGAPKMRQKLASVHRASNFPQLQKFVKFVMCTVCCLVWLVMFGESTLATLSQRETRVAKRLEVVSEASTPEIPLLCSVDKYRIHAR